MPHIKVNLVTQVITFETEVCWNRYKVAVDSDEGHRRRGDTMMEIRKNHREESLHKKRCEGLQSQQIPSSLHSTVIEKKVLSRCGVECEGLETLCIKD
ncbi:hypothetical protein JHK87_004360 [Glycine soja]|nr:hypothetical protein JHK87_004360 [Glycine soja]